MKSIAPLAWMLALLLCGCAASTPNQEPTETTQVTQEAAPTRLPSKKQGSVTTYCLESGSCAGILGYNENQYALLTTGGRVCLLLADTMEIVNARDLECDLSFDDPSIQVMDDQISYFDAQAGSYVTLGKNLTRISSVTIRDTIVAGPVITEDFSTIYYCTADGVRALDMATGNSRMLRQEHGTIESLDGIFFDGTVLRYTRRNGQGEAEPVFIRTEDGSQMEFTGLDGMVSTWGSQYAAVVELELPLGTCRQILVGELEGDVQELNIGTKWDSALFPGTGTALIQTMTADGVRAELYDLTDGTLRDSRVFAGRTEAFPHGWYDGTHLWLWGDEAQTLHRWTLAQKKTGGTCVLAPHSTLAQPDQQSMESLQARAQRLGEIYGMTITLTEGENRTNGIDYDGYPDYRPSMYRAALHQLYEMLETLPDGLTAQLAASGQLAIELVDDFDPAQGVSSGTGVLELTSPRVIRVSMCADLQKIFCHELFHAMELVIQSKTNLLEQWSEYNPTGFAYTGVQLDGPSESLWVEPESVCFADEFCLASAREDRAQTFLYAMLDDQAERFQTDAMQGKLFLLCRALREAFPECLNAQADLPWEQYLAESNQE